MTTAPRIIGIILCVILLIGALAFLAPAAIGLVGTSQGKGIRFGLAFADQKAAPASREEIKQIIRLLEARMEKLGVSNAIIEPGQGEGEAIQVFLPPGTDFEGARRLLTYIGLLELKLVAKGTSLPYATKEEAEVACANLEGKLNKYEVVIYKPREQSGAALTEGWAILEKTPVITGADVSNAQAGRSQYGGGWQIDFQLTPGGAARFGEATDKHVGDYLAIVLNNEVRSAPVINSRITDRGQISGGFTQRAAEDLAIALSTGALPRPLRVVSEQNVDASRWAGGYIKRILVSVLVLAAVLAFLYKLLRARSAPAQVYWPQTYGQSG